MHEYVWSIPLSPGHIALHSHDLLLNVILIMKVSGDSPRSACLIYEL